jgi:hypothetical protein
MMQKDTIVEIDPTKKLAHGKFRDVFLHPNDETKVLKVFREGGTPQKIRAQKWCGRFLPLARYDANAKDLREFQRIESKAPEFLDSVAPIFGHVETDRGTALVAGRVTNGNGSSCESLRDYVSKNGLGDVIPTLEDFFSRLIQCHILMNDFNPSNILLRRESDKLKPVIVDGLGNASLLPIRLYSKNQNSRKLLIKKKKLFAKLERLATLPRQKLLKSSFLWMPYLDLIPDLMPAFG